MLGKASQTAQPAALAQPGCESHVDSAAQALFCHRVTL